MGILRKSQNPKKEVYWVGVAPASGLLFLYPRRGH